MRQSLSSFEKAPSQARTFPLGKFCLGRGLFKKLDNDFRTYCSSVRFLLAGRTGCGLGARSALRARGRGSLEGGRRRTGRDAAIPSMGPEGDANATGGGCATEEGEETAEDSSGGLRRGAQVHETRHELMLQGGGNESTPSEDAAQELDRDHDGGTNETAPSGTRKGKMQGDANAAAGTIRRDQRPRRRELGGASKEPSQGTTSDAEPGPCWEAQGGTEENKGVAAARGDDDPTLPPEEDANTEQHTKQGGNASEEDANAAVADMRHGQPFQGWDTGGAPEKPLGGARNYCGSQGAAPAKGDAKPTPPLEESANEADQRDAKLGGARKIAGAKVLPP